MLILVIGEAGSGKTWFTEYKLFPYVGNKTVEIIREPTPSQLKDNNIPEKIKDSIVVIELFTDKDCPGDIRKLADLIVFTTHTAMSDYFGRNANDVADVRKKRVYSVVRSICGVDYTPVVFDPNAKRFIVHYD